MMMVTNASRINWGLLTYISAGSERWVKLATKSHDPEISATMTAIQMSDVDCWKNMYWSLNPKLKPRSGTFIRKVITRDKGEI